MALCSFLKKKLQAWRISNKIFNNINDDFFAAELWQNSNKNEKFQIDTPFATLISKKTSQQNSKSSSLNSFVDKKIKFTPKLPKSPQGSIYAYKT
jgi:hypothetical protein